MSMSGSLHLCGKRMKTEVEQVERKVTGEVYKVLHLHDMQQNYVVVFLDVAQLESVYEAIKTHMQDSSEIVLVHGEPSRETDEELVEG